MATEPLGGVAVGQSDGAAAPASGNLDTHVLSSPEQGRGIFYPATPDGAGALGLGGFAIGTAFISIVNAKWLSGPTLGLEVPIVLGYSALTTFIGGMWSFRANNLFDGVWQVSYAGFWIVLGLILQFFGPQVTEAAGAGDFSNAFGVYLILWAVFTSYLTVGAYFVAKPAFIAFAGVVTIELLLGISNLLAPASPSADLQQVAGYVGIITACIAWYVSAAIIINTNSGREILPIWPYPYGRS